MPVGPKGIPRLPGLYEKISFPLRPGRLSNQGLVLDHLALHRAWREIEGGRRPRLDGRVRSSEEILNAHALIVDELKRRKLQHPDPPPGTVGLDRRSRRLEKKVLIAKQAEKLTNERAQLRAADPKNAGERCGSCRFFNKPTTCKIIEGPVSKDRVCDWVQSRGAEVPAPKYTLADEDWIAFGRGMISRQPYSHIVRDVAITPEGPLVMIEDTAKTPHRFSLSKPFHIEHSSIEHHWTQAEVDELIAVGREAKVEKAIQERSRTKIIRREPAGLYVLRGDLLFRVIGEPSGSGPKIVLIERQRAPSEALAKAPKGTWDVSVVEQADGTPDARALARDNLGHRILVAEKVNGFLRPTESLLAILEPHVSKADKLVDKDLAEEPVRPPFGSPGGKWRNGLARKIASALPDHKTYVETFAGSAAILFQKEMSEIEVINDKDPETAFMLRFTRDATKNQVDRLRCLNWNISEPKFYELRDGKSPTDPVLRFFRAWNLQQKSYRAMRSTVHPNPETRRATPFTGGRFDRVHERLQGVKIRNVDYRKIIREFDGPQTVFYLDPPCPGQEQGVPGVVSIMDLRAALKSIKGSWILSVPLKVAKVMGIGKIVRVKVLRPSRVNNASGSKLKTSEFEAVVFGNCSSSKILTKSDKQQDPYLIYPNEAVRYKYVIQHHYRGRTVHLDIRFENEGKRFLIGWTVADLIAGKIKAAVDTVAKAKAADRDPANFKINPRTLEVKPRRTRAGVLIPANLQSFKKATQPTVWLNVEGKTGPFPAPGSTRNFPGVFTILERGRVEYGRQDSSFHEYFWSGGQKYKGRMIWRAIERRMEEPGSDFKTIASEFDHQGEVLGIFKQEVLPPGDQPEGDQVREAIFWVMIQPRDQRPNVLDKESVTKGFRPPVGKSALPEAVRREIKNPEWQYWKAPDSRERNKRHDALLDALDSGKITLDFDQLLKVEKQQRARFVRPVAKPESDGRADTRSRSHP